ncbi:hypothetical protein FRX31_034643, partial [Thalictrum thalictroides]
MLARSEKERRMQRRERGESRNPYKQMQIKFPLKSGRHSPNLLKRGYEVKGSLDQSKAKAARDWPPSG